MKLIFRSILILIGFSCIFSCAGRRAGIRKNIEVDGIIYFEKDEPGVKKNQGNQKKQVGSVSSTRQDRTEFNTKHKTKSEEGITYLDDQYNKFVAHPINRTSRIETGKASYYGEKFHGRTTASGEIYDQNKLTAAHPTLKFGTMVNVTNQMNDLSVTVKINDRGPFVKGRIIDVSKAAAQKIDMIEAGVVDVFVEIIREK